MNEHRSLKTKQEEELIITFRLILVCEIFSCCSNQTNDSALL